MKKIAFYGKGGIGKSTTAANVSAALSTAGHKVCQIGCDPKNDSTRLLLGHICKNTVLDMVRIKDEINLEDIVHYGFNGIKCVEAGGPEPGVGCAGRGIIVALEKLQELDAAGIELNYRNHITEPAIIVADPEQLKRVINNIISNSVKYMAEGRKGKIDIDLYDEGDYIHIVMADNGKGIAGKDISRIFERFYRTDESRNSKQGGSGIGLAIVKKIVEDHKGKIWAESVEGEGTTMHLNFLKYKENEHQN